MDGINVFAKIGNYGFHVFVWLDDLERDAGKRSGFKIWWNSASYEPRIEETIYWKLDHYDRARIEWRRGRNGKRIDGFLLEGPLVRFSA